MNCISTSVDPELIGGWLRARSVARGLPMPVADHGGWRVDTRRPEELRRYVFARGEEGLRRLADSIHTPKVFLKLCGSEQEMRALTGARWQIKEPRFVMTGEGFDAAQRPLAAGYSLQLTRYGPTVAARIVTTGGELAASGYAAESSGVFIYDLIRTEPAHRRRGLAAYLVQTLRTTRQSSASKQVLVATAEGRELYSMLGWHTLSPYTTAAL
jgi:hypothetical protein